MCVCNQRAAYNSAAVMHRSNDTEHKSHDQHPAAHALSAATRRLQLTLLPQRLHNSGHTPDVDEALSLCLIVVTLVEGN